MRFSPYLGIYRAQFAVTLASQLQYRVEALIWLFGAILQPLIYLIVWSTVSQTNGGSVGGYSTGAFAAYFVVLMLVNQWTDTWVMYEFESRIREGTFSPKLLRPIHPIHSDVADNVTHKFLTSFILIPVAVLLAVIFHATLRPPLWALAAFVPSLFLAFLLRFVVEWTVALACFWTTRVGAVNQMYAVAVMVLSGQMAPLSLFPPPVQTLATILPFRWMVAFPVDLATGALSPHDALVGCVTQAVWLALGVVLLNVVWRWAVRRYSAVGV